MTRLALLLALCATARGRAPGGIRLGISARVLLQRRLLRVSWPLVRETPRGYLFPSGLVMSYADRAHPAIARRQVSRLPEPAQGDMPVRAAEGV